MEAGTSPPHCGTMDVNLEFRGVDCNVGKTDTAVRTILCETGWENAESLDAFASQANPVTRVSDIMGKRLDKKIVNKLTRNMFITVVTAMYQSSTLRLPQTAGGGRTFVSNLAFLPSHLIL